MNLVIAQWICRFNFVNKDYSDFCLEGDKSALLSNCVREVGFAKSCNKVNGKCFIVRIFGKSCEDYLRVRPILNASLLIAIFLKI